MPPKGTVPYLAAELGEWSYALTRGMEHAEFAAELLGLTTTKRHDAIRPATSS